MGIQQKIIKYNVFKGFAIFLVVCIHVLYKIYPQDKPDLLEAFNHITGFAVPLFLMLGGYFLSAKLTKSIDVKDMLLLLKHLLRRVLLPYYIFVTILMAFRLFTGRDVSLSPYFLIDANTHGLYFIIIYIYAYIFSVLMFWIFNSFFKIWTGLVAYIVLPTMSLVFFPLCFFYMEHFPQNIVAGCLSYAAYFVFGFPVFWLSCKMERIGIKFYKYIFLGLFFISYTAVLYYARSVFGHFHIISDRPPTIFFLIYCIVVFLFIDWILSDIELFVKIGVKIGFERFGKQSLFIFFLHPYFVYTLPWLFSKLCMASMTRYNLFILPIIVAAYFLVFLSWGAYRLQPDCVRKIFSR